MTWGFDLTGTRTVPVAIDRGHIAGLRLSAADQLLDHALLSADTVEAETTAELYQRCGMRDRVLVPANSEKAAARMKAAPALTARLVSCIPLRDRLDLAYLLAAAYRRNSTPAPAYKHLLDKPPVDGRLLIAWRRVKSRLEQSVDRAAKLEIAYQQHCNRQNTPERLDNAEYAFNAYTALAQASVPTAPVPVPNKRQAQLDAAFETVMSAARLSKNARADSRANIENALLIFHKQAKSIFSSEHQDSSANQTISESDLPRCRARIRPMWDDPAITLTTYRALIYRLPDDRRYYHSQVRRRKKTAEPDTPRL